MRNLLVAVCCAALAGSVSVAYAQTASPANQDTIRDSNAKMKKKHMKKSMKKSGDSMSKDGMKKDTK